MIRAFLYGVRPIREDPTHPSLGFDRPVSFLWAEDRTAALALAEPALQWSDPDRWRAILAGTEPRWCLLDYPRLDESAEVPGMAEVDAAIVLGPFGFHYVDEEQCGGCFNWVRGLCLTCGLCPECKEGQGVSCAGCGELPDLW